jgi:hypothetical protein
MGVIACNKYGISGLRLFGKIEFIKQDNKNNKYDDGLLNQLEQHTHSN